MSDRHHDDALSELKRITDAFFRAVSFESGAKPAYAGLHDLFIGPGLLIKNSDDAPEICTVGEFIAPRQAVVDAGELTEFRETEIGEVTEVFGNVAHRFSAYAKSGTTKGVRFEGRGMICTQFVRTPGGWKMSAMAWDDERPGVPWPEHRLARLGDADGDAASAPLRRPMQPPEAS